MEEITPKSSATDSNGVQKFHAIYPKYIRLIHNLF